MHDQTYVREADVLAGGFSWPQMRKKLMRLEGNPQAIEQAQRLMFVHREFLIREPALRVVDDELEMKWQCGEHRLTMTFHSSGDVSFQCWPPDWFMNQVFEGLADVIIQRAASEIRRLPPPDPEDTSPATAPPAEQEKKPRTTPTVERRCDFCGQTFRRSTHVDCRNRQRGYHTFCDRVCAAAYRRSNDKRTDE